MTSKLKLSFSNDAPKGDSVTICLISEDSVIIPKLDKDVAAHLITKMASAQFTGKKGTSLSLYLDAGTYLLVGVGETVKAGVNAETIGGNMFAALAATPQKRGWLPAHKFADEVAADIIFGVELAAYHFEQYFTETDSVEASIQLAVSNEFIAGDDSVLADRQALANGVALARDLVFEPANKLYPVAFADRCVSLSELGLEVEVLDEADMEALGMGALLGVGQGSRRESRMVVMNWRGGKDEAPLALVGKGVTFDTGGISLKPPKGMEDMKWDMGVQRQLQVLWQPLLAAKSPVMSLALLVWLKICLMVTRNVRVMWSRQWRAKRLKSLILMPKAVWCLLMHCIIPKPVLSQQ